MLHLRARPLQTARALVLGPAPFFKIDGTVLRQGPEEQIVGRYQDQHWELATQFLSSFEVTDPTTVRFEDANERSAALR